MSDSKQETPDKKEDGVGTKSSEDRVADVYLGFAGGVEQRRRTQERIDWMHSKRAGESALDIGCSQGILPILLAKDGMTVTGVDINPNAIQRALELATEQPVEIRNRIEFLVADACNTAFTSQQFDTLFVGEVVEHLQNPEKLLQSACEKLREGGVFVLTTPHGYLPHDDHFQEFGLQELLDILPSELSVDTIDASNGYIYLKATKTTEARTLPNPETLLAVSTKSLIEQQKQFHELLNYRRDLINDLRAVEDKDLGSLQFDFAKMKAIAIRRKKELEAATQKIVQVTRIAKRRLKELEAAQKEVQKVTRIALRRRRVVEEMTIADTAQKQQIDSLEEGQKALSEEMALVKSRMAAQDVELQRKSRSDTVLRWRIELRKNEMQAITSSSIYQTGLALLLAIKKPFPNLFRLPLRLVKAALGRPLAIADPYRDTLLESVRDRMANMDETTADAPELPVGNLSVAQRVQLFRDAGDTEGEFQFIKQEADERPTEGVLRGLYWSSIRAEKFETAFEAIQRLEEFIGPSPTADQLKRLDQLRRGPGMNLATLAAIPARGERSYDAVPGRIAYVLHNSLPYSSGGYATRAHGLMTAAKASGIDPVCITRPGYPVDLKPELNASQIDLEDEINSIRYLRILEPSYQSGTGLVKYTQEAAEALIKVFKVEKPECVIAASAYRSALPALIAARSLGLPFIYEVRGFWEVTRISREPEYEHTSGFKVIRKIETEVAKGADKVITLTTPMKDELVARGVSEDRITLAPNSCDIDAFTPRDRDAKLAASLEIPDHVPVIGYVGTFVQYEGLEHLTEACVLLKERGLEFRLLLVGNENASGLDRGPITEQILETAEKAGIADWLIMPGRVPHEDVASYYSLIDIAPFPRKPQPVTEMVSPMKPLEAMAMEKAVVVSSVRALEEMVDHGITGLVFEKGSIASLADTLATLIDKPELRVSLGVAGREWVCEQRTWTKTATIVHDVVTNLTHPGEKRENLQAHETNTSI